MKKFLALLMCFLLVASVFTLTACDEKDHEEEIVDETDESGNLKTLKGKAPKALYSEATKMLDEATDFTMTTEQKITMKISGQTQTETQTIVQRVNGDNVYFKSSGIEGAAMECYYVDGVCYVNSGGTKNKATIDVEDYYEQYLGSDPDDDKLYALPEEWFNGVVICADGSKYYVDFTVSGDKFAEVAGDDIAEIASFDGDVSYRVYFDANGVLDSIRIEFTMEVMGIKSTSVSTSVFSNVGSTGAIKAPADADSYKDVTSSVK